MVLIDLPQTIHKKDGFAMGLLIGYIIWVNNV